ncbi:hypothetical protein [Tardiphaga sp. 367_B4_N1_1]|uniref:hypothetical protein n=1 Tax=Tardiphaga sp. 367_B4_N1_1 TaxID=3240777 RepID=UPI003F2006D7
MSISLLDCTASNQSLPSSKLQIEAHSLLCPHELRNRVHQHEEFRAPDLDDPLWPPGVTGDLEFTSPCRSVECPLNCMQAIWESSLESHNGTGPPPRYFSKTVEETTKPYCAISGHRMHFCFLRLLLAARDVCGDIYPIDLHTATKSRNLFREIARKPYNKRHFRHSHHELTMTSLRIEHIPP